MDRRKFIKTMGLAAGGVVLSQIIPAHELITTETKKTKKNMKIVVLTGSPRMNGNTSHMASQFIKGAEEAGHEVYRFDCAKHKIGGCIACNACGMNGDCILHDDFAELRPHLIEADMVVFATPMYYFGFSSQLKAVIDRFYAINGTIKGARKRSAFLMAYADTAPKEAEPMTLHYKTLIDYLGWTDCGMVVAPGMWPAGAVENTKYSRAAYELGKSLA